MLDPKDLPDILAAREQESYISDSYNQRVNHYSDWRTRIRKVDDFIRGDWTVEFPDGRTVKDRAKIENLVATGIQLVGSEAGGIWPTIRVEAVNSKGEERAQHREQVLLYYHQLSGTKTLLPYLFSDMAATGLACIKVMPDFRRPRAERFPLFTRVDPRGVLPPPGWMIGQEPEDVIVSKFVKLRTLKKLYPEAALRLQEKQPKLADTTEVQVVEYYSAEKISAVALTPGSGPRGAVTLYDVKNTPGCVSLILLPRPTADGRIGGQFDDVLGTLAAKNRIMTYVLDYMDQVVFSPVAKKNMMGQDINFGPNQVIDIPEDAEVGRIPPAPVNPAIFQTLASLDREARRGGIIPEARAGDVDASIISSAAIESLLGGYGVNLRAYHHVMEYGLRLANEVAFQQDRVWCDEQKTILSHSDGGLIKKTYRPSVLIGEGEHGNVVTYGVGTGVDAFNREVRILRREQAGYGSKRWARAQLEGMENAIKIENEFVDEKILDSLLAGVFAQAAQGNLEPVARLQAAREKKQDLLLVMADIVAAALPPEGVLGEGPAPGEGTQPTALPGEATPGQQVGAAERGGFQLPPLSSLLAG